MGAKKEAPKPADVERKAEVPAARRVTLVGIAHGGMGYDVYSVELPVDDPRVKVVTKRTPRENAMQLARTQLEGIYFKAVQSNFRPPKPSEEKL